MSTEGKFQILEHEQLIWKHVYLVYRLEEKLDAKLDKAEFYKVLTLLVALGGVVAAIVM